MKKIILLSSLCFVFLSAEVEIIDNTDEIEVKKTIIKKKVKEEFKQNPFKIDKEKALKDLENLIKNKSLNDSNKFKYGYFYGNLVKDNPELIENIYKLFKKSNYTDTFIIIRKYAGIKTKYFYNIVTYTIVDPLKYNKPSENIEGMLIGEYNYTRNLKYIDKLKEFSEKDKFSRYKLYKLRREIKEVDDYLNFLEQKKEIKKKKKKIKKISNKIPEEEFIQEKESITKKKKMEK